MITQVCVNVKTMKKPLNERFQELAGIKPLHTTNEDIEGIEGEELEVAETDNRDINTTKLYLSDGNYIEIDPIELMENAIENTDNPTLMHQFKTYELTGIFKSKAMNI